MQGLKEKLFQVAMVQKEIASQKPHPNPKVKVENDLLMLVTFKA